MKLRNSHLLVLRQLDSKIQHFRPLATASTPVNGWINTLRKALNMSLRQLGQKLSMTPQGIKDIETRETDGSITLKSLIEAGDALNMKFVYGFIPKDGSLEDMVEAKAREQALQIVKRTSTTMKLEDQENSKARLKQAVDELTQDIKREMPRSLWD